VKVFSSKPRIVAAAAFLLLALFLLRPGASRLKSRIISSLSAGVGRSVDLSSAHIRLLPRPGFDLDNLVVYDDPTFGAEPMLRASQVTADLRLTSLLRGRLEIARLDLTEPSLNLVHDPRGQWNLAALLERTAHTPTAPTAKAKLEPRAGFPYIEATAARINFKNGQEKTPYALTNADFSLWQESENAWGVRLKAQPVRTDLNLSDTGLLEVSGTWQRAATLDDTPLEFRVEWSRAQLGQVTKFFTRSDQGWRGAILIDAVLTGSPGQLKITSTASVNDFRRYDISAGQALRLAGSCNGEYSSLTHEFREVNCSAPIGKGLLTLTGALGFPGSRRYMIHVMADGVPANALMALVRRAKKNMPDDLVAGGTLKGEFSLRKDASGSSEPRFDGRGEIAAFRLSSAANNTEIGPETIPFALVSSAGSSPLRRKSAKSGAAHGRASARKLVAVGRLQAPEGPHIEFGPMAVDAGLTGSATVRGWVHRGGYELALAGDTEVGRGLRLARMIGLPALAANAEGWAQVELQIAGSWMGPGNPATSGFTGPQVTGNAKLHGVKVAVRGAGGAVEIVSADMQLLPDVVRVGKLNARAAGTTWTGSLETPRGCTKPETCPVRFALNTEDLSLAELNQWVRPSPTKRAWYEVLGNVRTGPSWLARVRGSGSVAAERFRIYSLTAAHVSANVHLDEGKIELSALNGDLLDGNHRGIWQVDFNLKPAVCSGSGGLAGVSLAAVGTATKNAWIAGTANATYEIKGPCSGEFWQSATGTLEAEIKDGVLPHLAVGDDARPLRIKRLDGQARMHDGMIEIDKAELDSPDGSYELSGTATLQHEIALTLTHVPNGAAVAGYTISGTLAEPRVAPLARTEQANLKPISSK